MTTNLKRHFKAASIGLFALAAAFLTVACTNNAQALEVGQCFAPAEMSRQLKAEGHGVVSSMNREVVDTNDNGKIVKIENIVTATPDLGQWYLVVGNAPLGQGSSRMCVSIKGTKLEINDHHANTPSIMVNYKFDHDKAIEGCKQIQQNFQNGAVCNSRDGMVDGAKKTFDENMALQGLSLDKNGKVDGLITFVANPGANKSFHILYTRADGATIILSRGTDFNTAPAQLDKVRSVKPGASSKPESSFPKSQ